MQLNSIYSNGGLAYEFQEKLVLRYSLLFLNLTRLKREIGGSAVGSVDGPPCWTSTQGPSKLPPKCVNHTAGSFFFSFFFFNKVSTARGGGRPCQALGHFV